MDDSRSLLALFRDLVAKRRLHPALAIGAYRSLDIGDDDIFAYLRECGAQRIVVALNFTDDPKICDLAQVGSIGRLLCSTHAIVNGMGDLTELRLEPFEGVVIMLSEE
jgi:alpha-glucosidase